MKKFAAIIKLLRPMLYPTVVADTFLGVGCAGLAIGSIVSPERIFLAGMVSVLLYAGGMVLNDIHDAKIDGKEGRKRPIPEGEISTTAAWIILGILWALAACALSMMNEAAILTSLTCLVFVLLYTFTHKKLKIVSPFLMGACRSLSVLIAVTALTGSFADVLDNTIVLGVALAYGLYVSAVTFISLLEEPPFDKGLVLSSILSLVVGCCAIIPMAIIPEIKYWFFLYLMISIFFVLMVFTVIFSEKRRKNLGKYIPVWLTPLLLLGSLGVIFFTLGDPVKRFLVPAVVLFSFFPILFIVFYANARREEKASD